MWDGRSVQRQVFIHHIDGDLLSPVGDWHCGQTGFILKILKLIMYQYLYMKHRKIGKTTSSKLKQIMIRSWERYIKHHSLMEGKFSQFLPQEWLEICCANLHHDLDFFFYYC